MAPPRVKISCINKDDRMSAYERIQSIGGVRSDGKRWRLSQKQAIADVIAGKWQFYVEAGNRLTPDVDVIVATSRFGNQYLKTTADGDEPNNLLSLDECPL